LSEYGDALRRNDQSRVEEYIEEVSLEAMILTMVNMEAVNLEVVDRELANLEVLVLRVVDRTGSTM
jgi:hypothetical protein